METLVQILKARGKIKQQMTTLLSTFTEKQIKQAFRRAGLSKKEIEKIFAIANSNPFSIGIGFDD